MRLLWSLIALLVVAAGALAIVRLQHDAVPAAPQPAPVAGTPVLAARPASAAASPALSTPPAPMLPPTPAPLSRQDEKPSAPSAAVPSTAAAPPAPLPPDLASLVNDALGETPTPSAPPAAKPAGPAATSAESPKVEKQPDGSLLVEGRFKVTGAGTKDDPYVIPWDYLASVSETYKPRLGQKKLPVSLDLINGKYVKITGYTAFPLMAQSPDEMLVMLNQWDGCCIGVPPTPYDAIEVKLRRAASGNERFATHGTVQGKLAVDPYLVKDWLVSLYAMSDASVKAE